MKVRWYIDRMNDHMETPTEGAQETIYIIWALRKMALYDSELTVREYAECADYAEQMLMNLYDANPGTYYPEIQHSRRHG